MQPKALFNRQGYPLTPLDQPLSDEAIAADWTLTPRDCQEIKKYRKNTRLYMAIQICAVRLYGCFLNNLHDLSTHVVNYLAEQLHLPPSWNVQLPSREATSLQHRQNILQYLGFRRFDQQSKKHLEDWLKQSVQLGTLPQDVLQQAGHYLLARRILLPPPSALARITGHICAQVHTTLFETISQRLSPQLRQTIDQLLEAPTGEQRSYFHYLKEYPPAATLSSIQSYLRRYQKVAQMRIDDLKLQELSPDLLYYWFKQAKRHNARELKRFADHKRYALMTCFLLEIRKILLDHLVVMHDQYIMEMCRKVKNIHEKKHRDLRKRQKKAIDVVLNTTHLLLDWPAEEQFSQEALWHKVDPNKLRIALEDLHTFQRLEERGYGDALVARYPSLRKYFADFIALPFVAEAGSEHIAQAIEIIKKLDTGQWKRIPTKVPTNFVPKELRRILKDTTSQINRNAWEMGLALAIKDALRAGNLYLPQSKQHVSFWNLTLSESRWQQVRTSCFSELEEPEQIRIKALLIEQFHQAITLAKERFKADDFAHIQHGQLKLRRYDKVALPSSIITLQKIIDARLPTIRIEQLLIEVDRRVQFSRHFTSSHHHCSQPRHFYRTLMATLISQATNLGIVAMSASIKDTTIDMLRHVLSNFIREETLMAANGAIVNQHHELPLSTVHGRGTISSSDAQRFGMRASSLLASYYPRYYGYYEKAIGIYTHVSDQYAVFNTQVISCRPREALYVLDGLLENNTVLPIKEHTTDTHGYSEIIFALCYLLGFYFMPRIRDLKDQQLYRVDRESDYGVFTPLLSKTADLNIIQEQWEELLRVGISLKQRTAPAHVIVQRLISSFPADRLSKAFTNLGRILKTQYILRYLSDATLREKVQLQLNKGEYRHKLPRRIFFADQGEFTTGVYEEIMNKASCLSLVSNAILYWNTLKIHDIIENLRSQGKNIDPTMLSHISLLPFKHVLPNGTYFIEDQPDQSSAAEQINP